MSPNHYRITYRNGSTVVISADYYRFDPATFAYNFWRRGSWVFGAEKVVSIENVTYHVTVYT